MRELTLTPTVVTIEINGEEYESRMSDVQVMSIADKMREKYRLLLDGNAAETIDVIALIKETLSCIDMILGDGAVVKISRGKPVSANDSMRWLTAIASTVTAAYGDKLVEEYA